MIKAFKVKKEIQAGQLDICFMFSLPFELRSGLHLVCVAACFFVGAEDSGCRATFFLVGIC